MVSTKTSNVISDSLLKGDVKKTCSLNKISFTSNCLSRNGYLKYQGWYMGPETD